MECSAVQMLVNWIRDKETQRALWLVHPGTWMSALKYETTKRLSQEQINVRSVIEEGKSGNKPQQLGGAQSWSKRLEASLQLQQLQWVSGKTSKSQEKDQESFVLLSQVLKAYWAQWSSLVSEKKMLKRELESDDESDSHTKKYDSQSAWQVFTRSVERKWANECYGIGKYQRVVRQVCDVFDEWWLAKEL